MVRQLALGSLSRLGRLRRRLGPHLLHRVPLLSSSRLPELGQLRLVGVCRAAQGCKHLVLGLLRSRLAASFQVTNLSTQRLNAGPQAGAGGLLLRQRGSCCLHSPPGRLQGCLQGTAVTLRRIPLPGDFCQLLRQGGHLLAQPLGLALGCRHGGLQLRCLLHRLSSRRLCRLRSSACLRGRAALHLS